MLKNIFEWIIIIYLANALRHNTTCLSFNVSEFCEHITCLYRYTLQLFLALLTELAFKNVVIVCSEVVTKYSNLSSMKLLL
jgi:hypothetical protein